MKRFFSIIIFLCLASMIIMAETIKVGRSTVVVANISEYQLLSIERCDWSSSGSCISISPSGIRCTVSGRSKGSATVTCKWKCKYKGTGEKSGSNSFYISVQGNDPEDITIYPVSMELNVGESQTVSADVYPSDAEYKSISWSLSNTSVASFSGSGTSVRVTATQPTSSPVNLIATVDNSISARCSISIFGTNPTGLSLSKPGNLIAETSGTQLKATFTPSNHRSSITWSSDNTQVATINNAGVVSPIAPGTATITAKTANGLTTTTDIKVVEPSFDIKSTSPNNNSTNVDVLTACSITYSLAVHGSNNTTGVKLTGGGIEATGQMTFSGNTMTFTPDKALKPQTQYTLSIPEGVILNKWGTSYPAYQLTFKTGNLRPLAISNSLPQGFVWYGDETILEASVAGATIYYTTDGSEPTENSKRYTSPIVVDRNFTLRARAYKNGYETPEVKAEYKLSTIRVAQKYPLWSELLYLYQDVNPFVEYTFDVIEGPQFNKCKVTTADGLTIAGTFVLHGRFHTFVPDKPLPLGKVYTVSIPDGAVMLHKDDQSKAFEWTFVSGMFYRNISAGYGHYCAIRTDNNLYGWGERPLTALANYDYNSEFHYDDAIVIGINVKDVSCGSSHTLFTKYDGKLYGTGLQYCGELGNGSVFSVEKEPLELQDNVSLITAGSQSSAFIQDGKLMGVGKNDFHQVNSSNDAIRPSVDRLYASVANPKIIESGFGNFYAVSKSGQLYGIGDNSYGQLLNGNKVVESSAVLMMENVDTVAASKWREGHVAVIKKDHTLWTWGNNCYGQLGDGTFNNSKQPIKVMDDVIKVAVGDYCMAAITSNNELWMWGRNYSGQLGQGNYYDYNTPQKVNGTYADISLGKRSAIALDTDGSVFRWGTIPNGKEFNYVSESPVRFLEGRSSETMTGVEIVNNSILMGVNSKAVVCAKPVPLKANYQKWEWSTSDASVATVDNRGVVTAVAKGKATITLTSDEGKKATCNITVDNEASGITEINAQQQYFDIYDLQGHKIRSQVNTTEGLSKGIYIVNGKKIIIK